VGVAGVGMAPAGLKCAPVYTVVGGMYCARRRGWHSQLAALRQLNVLPLEMQVAEVGQQKARLPREMWIEKYNGRPRPPRNSTVRPNLNALTWRQCRSIFQECPCMRRCNFPTPVRQRSCAPMLTSIPTRIWLHGCHGSGHACPLWQQLMQGEILASTYEFG
jgi:hypothetical protein